MENWGVHKINKIKISLFLALLVLVKISTASDSELSILTSGDSELYAHQAAGDEELGVSDSPEITPAPSPDGGGGAGAATKAVEKAVFSIYPQLIQSLLPKEKDQIKTFSIYNNGTSLLILKLNVINLEKIINLSEYYVRIKPGEEKTIEMNILAEGEMPGIYTGEIQAVAKSLVKTIPIVIEIESESPLFDVLAEIPEDYAEIEQGKPLVSKITLENRAVTRKNVNTNVTYYIKDFEGNNLYEEKEIISVEDVITYSKRFDINLEEGDYLLAIKIDYENTTAVSSSTFRVIPRTVQGMKRSELTFYYGIILTLVAIVIISMLNYKKIKKFGGKKLKFKIKDDSYREKKDIIDKAYKEGIIKKRKKK